MAAIQERVGPGERVFEKLMRHSMVEAVAKFLVDHGAFYGEQFRRPTRKEPAHFGKIMVQKEIMGRVAVVVEDGMPIGNKNMAAAEAWLRENIKGMILRIRTPLKKGVSKDMAGTAGKKGPVRTVPRGGEIGFIGIGAKDHGAIIPGISQDR